MRLRGAVGCGRASVGAGFAHAFSPVGAATFVAAALAGRSAFAIAAAAVLAHVNSLLFDATVLALAPVVAARGGMEVIHAYLVGLRQLLDDYANGDFYREINLRGVVAGRFKHAPLLGLNGQRLFESTLYGLDRASRWALAVLSTYRLQPQMLLMVLAASASYIAVPAVVRFAIPEADPSLYVGLSLGLTFPLNIVLGIPLYTQVVRGLWGA